MLLVSWYWLLVETEVTILFNEDARQVTNNN